MLYGVLSGLEKLRFFAELARGRRQPRSRLVELLTEAEIDCKSTGLPDEAICRGVLLRLAGAARQRRN